jgi:hypothetical protein
MSREREIETVGAGDFWALQDKREPLSLSLCRVTVCLVPFVGALLSFCASLLFIYFEVESWKICFPPSYGFLGLQDRLYLSSINKYS